MWFKRLLLCCKLYHTVPSLYPSTVWVSLPCVLVCRCGQAEGLGLTLDGLEIRLEHSPGRDRAGDGEICIRGRCNMMGYFKDNNLDVIDVQGNGQTIYYAKDEEDKFIGVNRGESSNLRIKLVDNEIDQIAYINDGNATFFPIGELSDNELRLRGFSWKGHVRPKKREDIFKWIE